MGLGNIFLALHPPWHFVPVVTGLVSYGVAGLDPAASAWVGSRRHAGGFLGCYRAALVLGLRLPH